MCTTHTPFDPSIFLYFLPSTENQSLVTHSVASSNSSSHLSTESMSRGNLLAAFIFFLLLILNVSGVLSVTFTVTNKCNQTVWPAIIASSTGTSPLNTTGFQLQKDESRNVTVPSLWSGRFWGRTHCSTQNSRGFSCISGDCGSRKVECSGNSHSPPATLAEFSLTYGTGLDFYDVSFVEGFNLPILLVPESGNCTAAGCAVDLNDVCPPELKPTRQDGIDVGCRSACEVSADPQYCCTGAYNTPDTCKPTPYSKFFKNACPRAYSYTLDDFRTSRFTCPPTNYAITFCPPLPTSKKPTKNPKPRNMGATFTVTNKCNQTVWPALSTTNGTSPLTTGFQLQNDESRNVIVPWSWTGRFWGRTHCNTQNSTGRFSCISGDCGSGKVECLGNSHSPPVTLAEFTLTASPIGIDSYNVSFVDGTNLPMLVVPESGNCTTAGCAVDLNDVCPIELKATSQDGIDVGCKSACEAFTDPQYCCIGAYGTPDTCKPTPYSKFFKNACPRAYSYLYDDSSNTFQCPSTNYAITFCPPLPTIENPTKNPEAAGGGGSLGPVSSSSTAVRPSLFSFYYRHLLFGSYFD